MAYAFAGFFITAPVTHRAGSKFINKVFLVPGAIPHYNFLVLANVGTILNLGLSCFEHFGPCTIESVKCSYYLEMARPVAVLTTEGAEQVEEAFGDSNTV